MPWYKLFRIIEYCSYSTNLTNIQYMSYDPLKYVQYDTIIKSKASFRDKSKLERQKTSHIYRRRVTC